MKKIVGKLLRCIVVSSHGLIAKKRQAVLLRTGSGRPRTATTEGKKEYGCFQEKRPGTRKSQPQIAARLLVGRRFTRANQLSTKIFGSTLVHDAVCLAILGRQQTCEIYLLVYSYPNLNNVETCRYKC